MYYLTFRNWIISSSGVFSLIILLTVFTPSSHVWQFWFSPSFGPSVGFSWHIVTQNRNQKRAGTTLYQPRRLEQTLWPIFGSRHFPKWVTPSYLRNQLSYRKKPGYLLKDLVLLITILSLNMKFGQFLMPISLTKVWKSSLFWLAIVTSYDVISKNRLCHVVALDLSFPSMCGNPLNKTGFGLEKSPKVKKWNEFVPSYLVPDLLRCIFWQFCTTVIFGPPEKFCFNKIPGRVLFNLIWGCRIDFWRFQKPRPNGLWIMALFTFSTPFFDLFLIWGCRIDFWRFQKPRPNGLWVMAFFTFSTPFFDLFRPLGPKSFIEFWLEGCQMKAPFMRIVKHPEIFHFGQ